MTKPRTQSFTVKVTIPETPLDRFGDTQPFTEGEIRTALVRAFSSDVSYGGVTIEVEDNAAARKRRKAANEAAAKARYEAHRAHAQQAQEED